MGKYTPATRCTPVAGSEADESQTASGMPPASKVIASMSTGTNLIVFRDSAQEFSGAELTHGLLRTLENVSFGNRSSLIDALVVSGQAESSLADCNSRHAEAVARISDALAENLVAGKPFDGAELSHQLQTAAEPFPRSVRVSSPEGFAYYALHPEDFADAIRTEPHPGSMAIVGIRSIGTVLSAIAASAARKQGSTASRITVRPTGHPYDRQTRLTEAQRRWIRRGRDRRSRFLVLDEGPGLSGSSFISVGESLIEAGAEPSSITLVGTRDPDPAQLCAPDAARRWKRFRWKKATSRILERFNSSASLSAGAWRGHFLDEVADWPPCWPEMETAKFLSSDGNSIFKFEGFGRFGKDAREGAATISEAGFGPQVENAGDGMNAYPVIGGRPCTRSQLSSSLLDHMARYCAFRRGAFPAPRHNSSAIEEMVRFNFKQQTARELEIPAGIFQSEHPAYVDSRMQPHKWIASPDGRILKLDACTHGDDHFLPGPTDILWDLAGAIVEWDMDRHAEQSFVTKYHELVGSKKDDRLPFFVLAYTVFRMSYSKMAMAATAQVDECFRLRGAYQSYGRRLNLSTTGQKSLSSRVQA